MEGFDKKEQLDLLEPNGSNSPPPSNGFEKLVYALNRMTHSISMIVLFFMMCLTTFDVIGRTLLKQPIRGAFELTGISLLILVFCSLGYAQLKGDHVSIDFLTGKFPQGVQRALSIVFSVIMFILLLMTSWQLFLYSNRVDNQTVGDLPLPLDIFAIVAAVGILFFAVTLLLKIVHAVKGGLKG
jgi:TRAP-type C4-dicarboxylate transport system permease small subunit